jgi:hypothetical protein
MLILLSLDLISDGSTTWIAYPDGVKVRVTAMTLENI